MVDIVTIGAGGGSIVWRDDGDMLRVGPRSAGADPGPACYGRGGTEPTLSDAHVVCGRLPGDTRLAGRFKLEPEAASRAFAPMASALGSPLAEAAESAIRLAESNIVAAIRLVSTERGHDPREFALVPYGGAGPLHAAPIAAELGIATVVVPPDPGVVSAYGLLAADHVLLETLTRRVRVDEAAAGAVRDAAEVLRATLRARADELGLAADASWEFALDMRYAGQAYEIEVPLELDALAGLDREELGRRFGSAHRRIYQHGSVSGKAVEIVSFRLALRVPQPEVPPIAVDAPPDGAPPSVPARLFADGAWREARRVARRAIAPGEGLDGPAIVVDATATTYVPAGWRATGGASGELVLRRTS
jgi:N-methylhydantoinase A